MEKFNYLLDEYESGKNKSLLDVLIKRKEKDPKALAQEIRDSVEKSIENSVKFASHSMFYMMEALKDFQGFSWHQINYSFCRNVLNLKPDKKITQKDIDDYLKTVFELRKSYNLDGVPADQVKSSLTRITVNIFGKEFPIYSEGKINNILSWLGSDKRLISGLYEGQIGFIFGKISKEKIGEFEVYIMESEGIRSPNRVLQLAAVISDNQIFLRKEAFQSIFYDKWAAVFKMEKVFKEKILKNDSTNVLLMIQQKALEFYGVNSLESLIKNEEKIISELMETTLYHEYGHGILEKEISSLDDYAVAGAMANFGENVVSILAEFLSDFAPKKGEIEGPISHILNIGLKEDKKKASRMLLSYLSDKWIHSKATDNQNKTAAIFAGILLKYIKKDGTFDFKVFSVEIDKLYSKMLDFHAKIIIIIRRMLEEADFVVRGGKQDFKSLEIALKEIFTKNDGKIDEKSSNYKNAFWHQVVLQTIKFSPSATREIKELLSVKLIDFERIIRSFTGINDPVTAMKNLGFYRAI